ncbi:hypothetical protein [Rhodococcus sp. 11-3]|nr:hypothetical protein [Rhodococcus sp. 11-3]
MTTIKEVLAELWQAIVDGVDMILFALSTNYQIAQLRTAEGVHA